ncbi:hypothetical protein SK128_026881 [Halocaridina rubra]|uniref:Uncharacterized protein n=1 Tax=Halocaridina rubra TaxID=373956 RepID=A0AAN8XGC7_HALRR
MNSYRERKYSPTGRIILVSSPTGQVAVPNLCAYSASKWGMEGFAQALRREVQRFGVSVSVVRPCNLPNRTGILRRNSSQLREMLENASVETKEDFGSIMKQAESVFAEGFGKLPEIQDIKDNGLIRCFRSAILNERPNNVYSSAPLVVRLYLRLAQIVPTRLLDFIVINGVHEALMMTAYNK